MNLNPLWWHWIAFGIGLSILEIFVPSFTVIWFGIGAILTGIAVLALGIRLNLQILVWAVSSSLMAAAWFLWIHPRVGSKPDLVQPEWKDRRGIVRKAGGGMEKGTVEFQTPLLSDTTWPFVSDAPVGAGDEVEVVGVEGQLLRVRKTAAAQPGTAEKTAAGAKP